MPETLASLRAERHHRLLSHTARQLLFDWRAAAEIMEQTWKKAADNLHQFDPALANLGAWVCCIRDRLTSDYVDANGYTAPLTDDQIRLLDLSEEEATAIRERRAGLAERINTLPPTLREAAHTWLAGRPIDPATGVRVRVGLQLLNRRRAA